MVALLRHGMSGSALQILEVLANLPRGENSREFTASETRLIGKLEGAEHFGPNDLLRYILAELWTSIVKTVLSALKLKKSANPPRVWWCPIGPFTSLPIHAAGIYGEPHGDCVSDYVISSYTPTLAALLDPPTQTATPFKMTAIIQPETAGCSPLLYTKVELTKIEERVPNQWLTSLGRNEQATVATALFYLQKSSIVHFACHGTQDVMNPLDSGVLLTDGRLKVSQIIRRPEESPDDSQRKYMSLAFLSACETAKGDDELPDEAMHLAATLLFAGFRGVVATMWTIADPDGPKIADTFYQHLFRNCDVASDLHVLPDLTDAARALHLAVAKLREDPNVDFTRWVPFVHYGL
ncbi:CHAT domain-containing protein [Mycena sp. CBHHK59/15]|nr:CHAT domain-containing protein [Mycena sp. CBHHK59/15]